MTPSVIFDQFALDTNTDYFILNQHQIARLLIAYEKICPQDGKPFDSNGRCPNGHCLDVGISLNITVSEKTRYTITDQRDVSHGEQNVIQLSLFLTVTIQRT